MSENLFRIDGFYRDGRGYVVKLIAHDTNPDWAYASLEGDGFPSDKWKCDGARNLSDGRYVFSSLPRPINLLHGELHQVNGEWVPIEDELLALQTRPQHEPASCEEAGDEHLRLLKVCLKNALVEPKRPPLAYFSEAKRFDAFPGFITETGCVNGAGHRIGGVSPFRDLSLDGCESFKAPRSI